MMKRLSLILLCLACACGASDLPHRRAHVRSSSWWLSGGVDPATVVAVYQPKGAASLAASYINLANPGTYNAAPGTAPVLSAGGWVHNNGAYLRTGIIPAENWTMIVRISGASVSSRTNCVAGSYDGHRFTLLSCTSLAEAVAAYGYDGSRFDSVARTSGVMAIAGSRAFFNGQYLGTASPSITSSHIEIFLGARNNAGTADGLFIGTISSAEICSGVLTDAQVQAISSAMP